MKKVKKIKFSQNKTSITYEVINDAKQEEKYQLTTPEQPTEEFRIALQTLNIDTCIINEINPKIAEDLIIIGITLSYKDMDSYKMTIQSKRVVSLSNSPMNISTPLIILGNTEEGDENYKFKIELDEKVQTILKLAEDFIEGDREQSEQSELEFEEV